MNFPEVENSALSLALFLVHSQPAGGESVQSDNLKTCIYVQVDSRGTLEIGQHLILGLLAKEHHVCLLSHLLKLFPTWEGSFCSSF